MSDTAQTQQPAPADTSGQPRQATDSATETPSAPAPGPGPKVLQPLAAPEAQAGSCCGGSSCH